MKVVLDTNIIISGIFWKGPPNAILNLWLKDKIQAVATKAILNEYIGSLKNMDTNPELLNQWSVFILENIELTKDQSIFKICRDPDDNKFLNCTMSAEADYLITGDKDLLSLKDKVSVKIVSAQEFLKITKN